MSLVIGTPEERRPALRPPQFRLSTLLAGMAILCAVLATFSWIGPIGAFALVLLIFLVMAHISGNALGMQLRSNGDRPVDEQDRPLGAKPRYDRLTVNPTAPTRLREHRRLGMILAAAIVLTIALGAGGGAWWTVYASGKPASLPEVILAATAFGVLGGIGGLMGGGFVVVGISAWREALRGARTPDAPR